MYRRDSLPATIDPETGAIEPMDPARFQTYAEQHLVCFAWRGNIRQPETMTFREANAVLRCDAFIRPLRKLRRVNQVRLPVMRADGAIELLPKGWDPASQIFTMGGGGGIDWDPGWDLERARLFLDDLLGEFPFEDAQARAAHILAMLAVFGADLLPSDVKRLNFLWRANIPRAGKGLLMATAIAPAHGSVRIQAIPEEAAELRKVLDTEAMNGSPYLLFDEVERTLSNRTLNAFLTASVWTGRLLGSQKLFQVPQNAVVFLAGNNVELSSDLTGRFVLIDLFVREVDPQDREIKRVLTESYLTRPEVRADVLAALYGLVRNWDKRLRPPSSAMMVGFEKFSQIFGGIVEAAGYDCPVRSLANKIDPDLRDMTTLVEKLAAGVQHHYEYEFGELVAFCRELNTFEWLVPPGELSGKERSSLGKIFGLQYAGTIFRLSDGRRVQFGRRGNNRQRRYTIEIIGHSET
jgi:hypothetical protein